MLLGNHSNMAPVAKLYKYCMKHTGSQSWLLDKLIPTYTLQ